MDSNYLSTLSKFNPEQKDSLLTIVRKSQQHEDNHAKADFFDKLELVFIWIFAFCFCVVAWRQIFLIVGSVSK